MVNYFVSVIIPTFNDWRRLALCLDGLSKQSYPVASYEIIVINNNPKDSLPINMVLPGNCELIVESNPGSYAARNKGLAHSRGDVIAFTDSDCIPDENWLKNAVNFFSDHPQCSRIAGHISLFFRNPSKLTWAEKFESVYAFKQERLALLKGSSVTANMISHRYVFDQVGQFDLSMMSGGDHEWADRAQRAGFTILYGKNVIVNHPSRSDFRELVKKAKRVAGGDKSMLSVSKTDSVIAFIKSFKPPFHEYSSLIARYGTSLTGLDRVVVFALKYYLNLVSAFEKFRISAFRKKALRE